MPRIGLLSDSHGQWRTTQAGVQWLVTQKVDVIFHLGDVGSMQVIDTLAGLTRPDGVAVPVRMVFGNTDYDWQALSRYAIGLGIEVDHPAGRLSLDDADSGVGVAELVYTHGDDGRIMTQALKRQVRYLCHGHTHRQADSREGDTRIINPGALQRASFYSVAVLDTRLDKVVFHTLEGMERG